MAKRFRFRKFKITIKKRRFKLYGEFNPWVLLADGSVDYIDKDAARGKELGDIVTHKGQKGYIIGKHDFDAPGSGIAGTNKTGSQFVREIDDNTVAAQKLLNDISKARGNKKKVKDLIGAAHETSKHSAELRKKMVAAGKTANPGDHAHHLVPSTHAGGKDARKILDKHGIDFNDAVNGVFLSPSVHAPLHTTKYMKEITKRIKRASKSRQEVLDALKKIEQDILNGNFPY